MPERWQPMTKTGEVARSGVVERSTLDSSIAGEAIPQKPSQKRVTKVTRDYSTPAIAASTPSTSAPTSRPSEAAAMPGDFLEHPEPLARQR